MQNKQQTMRVTGYDVRTREEDEVFRVNGVFIYNVEEEKGNNPEKKKANDMDVIVIS